MSYLFSNSAVESVCSKNGHSSKSEMNKIIADVPSSIILSQDNENFEYNSFISSLTEGDQKLISPSYIPSSNVKQFEKYAVASGNDSRSLLSNLSKGKIISSHFVFKNSGLNEDAIKSGKDKFLSNISGIKSNSFKSVESSVFESKQKNSSAVIGVHNSSSVGGHLRWISDQFDKLYERRKYVHWFVGEGIDESTFVESREKIETIVSSYEKCT